jgi:hypothetical protein
LYQIQNDVEQASSLFVSDSKLCGTGFQPVCVRFKIFH